MRADPRFKPLPPEPATLLTEGRLVDAVKVLRETQGIGLKQARAWIASGDVPELARAKHVEYVDIDSGHWPMITKPADLARLLAAAAQE